MGQRKENRISERRTRRQLETLILSKKPFTPSDRGSRTHCVRCIRANGELLHLGTENHAI